MRRLNVSVIGWVSFVPRASLLVTEGRITLYDDVRKWKHFPGYWPFVWGSRRPSVNSPHKGQ